MCFLVMYNISQNCHDKYNSNYVWFSNTSNNITACALIEPCFMYKLIIATNTLACMVCAEWTVKVWLLASHMHGEILIQNFIFTRTMPHDIWLSIIMNTLLFFRIKKGTTLKVPHKWYKLLAWCERGTIHAEYIFALHVNNITVSW